MFEEGDLRWVSRCGAFGECGYRVGGIFVETAKRGRPGGDCAGVGAIEQGCQLGLVRGPCAGGVYEGRGDDDVPYRDHGALGDTRQGSHQHWVS